MKLHNRNHEPSVDLVRRRQADEIRMAEILERIEELEAAQ